MDSLSAYILIREVKTVFAEFGLPKKTVSDAGTNFISDKFKIMHHFYLQCPPSHKRFGPWAVEHLLSILES